MQENFIVVNGNKIAVDDKIQFERNSPFDDKETLTVDGTTYSTRGSYSMPFSFVLSGPDILALGIPTSLQAVGQPTTFNGVSFISRGFKVAIGQLVIKKVDIDLNTYSAKVECVFFYQAAKYVDLINNLKVNTLKMDGIRTIAATAPHLGYGVINRFTSPYLVEAAYINPSGPFTPTLSSQMNVYGRDTDIYATAITTGGDPYICFPFIRVPDENATDGFRTINYWDTDANAHFSSSFKAHNITSGAIQRIPDSGVSILPLNEYFKLDNSVIPMYYYWQILKHCFSEFGYKLDTSTGLLADPQFRKLVLVNTYDILNDWLVYTENINDSGQSFNTGYYQDTTTIDPSHHLTDMLITDFLHDFNVKFNCYFKFDGANVSVVYSELNNIDTQIGIENPISPKVMREPNITDPGMILGYELGDKAYDAVKAFTTPITTLPEPTAPIPLATGTLYIDPITNSLDKRVNLLNTDADRIADNLIPYDSEAQAGSSGDHSYSLQLPPVTQAYSNYSAPNDPSATRGVAQYGFMAVMPLDVQVFPTVVASYQYTTDSFINEAFDRTLGAVSFNVPNSTTSEKWFCFGTTLDFAATPPAAGTLNIKVWCQYGTITIDLPLTDSVTGNSGLPSGGGSLTVYNDTTIVIAHPTGTSWNIIINRDPAYMQTYALTDVNADARAGSAGFYSGFYWGVMGVGDMIMNGKSFPYISNHNFAPGAASPRLGWFSLSPVGSFGLVATFWRLFVNMFVLNEKRTFYVAIPLHDIVSFDFRRAVLINGRKYYISKISYSLPYVNYAMVDCWCI